MIINNIKQKLGEATEQLEQYLEPWQRGALIVILTLLLILSIYYLTKPDKQYLTDKKESQKEREIEERLMRQMAFFKRLKE